jgi:cytidylate kinase
MTGEESCLRSQEPCRKTIIAIDGPAGAGKSTIARHLAGHFGLLNLETGAMYRAFALKALRAGLPLDESQSLEALAAETTISLEPGDEENRVLLDGEDVTGLIRNATVTDAASRVSVFPAVRAWMVRLQQQLGAAGGVVMEGRDIGTVVFPHADVKIFLDAAPEVRGATAFRSAWPRRPETRGTTRRGHTRFARARRTGPQSRRFPPQAGPRRRAAGFNRHDARRGSGGG